MATVQDIPLVRSRYLHCFAVVLDKIGAPTGRYLQRVRLTDRIMENCEEIISAQQAWSFIGMAAEKEGIDDFGIQAGRISIAEYGEFSHHLLQSPNLNQTLKRFCQLARHEYSRADFYVAKNGEKTWFCRGPIDGQDVEKKHVELLVLTMMLATVRLVAGSDWRPSELFLQTGDFRGVDGHERPLSPSIYFGSRITAFEIPSHLLPKRMSPPAVPPSCGELGRLDDDIVGAMRHVLTWLPAARPSGIAEVAEAVGMNPRTLQRRLSEANTTFSALVEDSRMTQAMAMLADRSMKLASIAVELGYSDHANFTRAFRRWTGVSPRTYRRQQMTDQDDGAE